MINVRMGEPNLFKLELLLGDEGQDQIQVAAWVNHRSLFRLVIPNYRAVLLKGRDGNGLVLKHVVMSMCF